MNRRCNIKLMAKVLATAGASLCLVAGLVSPVTAESAANETEVVPAAVLESSPSTTATQTAEADFVAANAADGRLYDASEVQSGAADGVTAVWTDAVDLSKVMVTAPPSGNADSSAVGGLGAVGDNNPDATDQQMAQLGSNSLEHFGGVWGDPTGGTVQVTVSGFRLVSGWERFRVRESRTDREVFYYGHWATAYGKSVSGFDPAPYVVDVRSRPKAGTRGNILQLRDYWPKASSAACRNSASIGISILVFNADLPLQNCSSLSPEPDVNSITMKNVWSAGTCKDSTAEGADLAMLVDTRPTMRAVLSDYSYARFDSGGPFGASACNISSGDDVRAIYADPGW